MEKSTTKRRKRNIKDHRTNLNAIADCRIGFCHSPILYTSRAYIQTGIKKYTTKSTTKELVPNEVGGAKNLKLYITRSSHGVSVVHLEGRIF